MQGTPLIIWEGGWLFLIVFGQNPDFSVAQYIMPLGDLLNLFSVIAYTVNLLQPCHLIALELKMHHRIKQIYHKHSSFFSLLPLKPWKGDLPLLWKYNENFGIICCNIKVFSIKCNSKILRLKGFMALFCFYLLLPIAALLPAVHMAHHPQDFWAKASNFTMIIICVLWLCLQWMFCVST